MKKKTLKLAAIALSASFASLAACTGGMKEKASSEASPLSSGC